MAKHVISVLVDNHAGILSKVTGLFSRRGFNIESLAVGITKDPKISRITIVVDGDDYVVQQLTKQLAKLIDVRTIKQMFPGESVNRELLLIKLSSDEKTRGAIIEICNIFRAKIVDVSLTSLTVEMTGSTDKIDALLNMLSSFNFLEVVRTGLISIERGTNTLNKDDS